MSQKLFAYMTVKRINGGSEKEKMPTPAYIESHEGQYLLLASLLSNPSYMYT